MVQKEFLKTIIDTFDLNDERKMGLYLSYSHKLDRFTTDIDLYRYITDLLVQKFNTPINFIRLDQPIKYDSKRLFHDIIGTLDNNLESLLNEPDEEDDSLTINEALSILKNELDSLDYAILEQLIPQDPEAKLNLNYESLINNIPQIQKRIKIFSNNSGNILIPKRPIIEVKFIDEDFKIIYGKRRFDGNPLAYFRKYYSNLQLTNRFKLKEIDKGLYTALYRYKQMDKALPKYEFRIGSNPLAYFLKYYGNKSLTRKQLQNLDQSLFNALHKHKQMELAISTTVHNHYNGDPLSYFREKYKDKKIGRSELGQDDDGLYRALIRTGDLDKAIPGKKTNGSQRRYINEENIRRIINLYHEFNGNACQASKNSQYSWDTLTKYWMDLGLKIIKCHTKTDEEINRIVDSYKDYNGSAMKASLHLHYNHSTITKYWKKAGLKTRNLGQRSKNFIK